MTKIRREILEIVKCSSRPLLIKEIIDELRIKVDLSSVYRALKFLFDSKKIHLFSFKNRKYYFSNQKEESGHFLICKSCNEIRSFDSCIAESLQKNFSVIINLILLSIFCILRGIVLNVRSILKRRENMINSLKYILSIILIIIMLFSCSADRTENNDSNSKLQIAVSIYPLFDIVRNITGEKADVFYLVPPGANPHIFEPAPRDIEKLLKADIFFGISENFDSWIGNMFLSEVHLYYLAESNLQLRQNNPHVWLSVIGAIKLSEKIYNILSIADPENQKYYLENYREYKEELLRLDEEFEGIFTKIENRKFIQWHPAWDYFAEDYNLEIIGTIQSGHGDEPSIKEIQQLIEKAEENNVKVVVIGLDEHSPTAEVFSSEIGGILLKLDAIGDPQEGERSTYIDLMRFNAEKLSKSLKNQ